MLYEVANCNRKDIPLGQNVGVQFEQLFICLMFPPRAAWPRPENVMLQSCVARKIASPGQTFSTAARTANKLVRAADLSQIKELERIYFEINLKLSSLCCMFGTSWRVKSALAALSSWTDKKHWTHGVVQPTFVTRRNIIGFCRWDQNLELDVSLKLKCWAIAAGKTEIQSC